MISSMDVSDKLLPIIPTTGTELTKDNIYE
jgi:hypothetical protein